MFLGHFAVGMVASRFDPHLRLGTALLAAQLPDLIWPLFLLSGVESVTIAPGTTPVTPLVFDHYPWSHSLAMVVAWGLLLTLLYMFIAGRKWATILMTPLVVSHWVLDAIAHRADLPLLPLGGPHVGLGLWESLPLTLVVEGSLFGGAIWFFARGRRLGAAFWSLAAVLAVVYLASVFGPPPPSPRAIAFSMLSFVPLLWFWGNKAGEARVSH
jgi:hypothetical protein